MRIVVTGGCGYKGTVLTNYLLGLGHTIIALDTQWFGNYLVPQPELSVQKKDIRYLEFFPQDVDAIIHLAAVANDPCALLDSSLSWEVNTLATMQLVQFAIHNGVQHFIYASSGSVYGVKEEPEVTEDLPLVPLSDYNKTKMITERVLLSYQDKVKISIVRPATVCGFSPRMRFDVAVNLLTIQALEQGKITVLGGDQVRPNIHIQDITRLYSDILMNPDRYPHLIYNAGFENISILRIAEMVQEKVKQAQGHQVDIEVQPSNDPRSYRLNSDRLLGTGFYPQYTVADAIDTIILKYNQGLRSEDSNYNIRWMRDHVLKNS